MAKLIKIKSGKTELNPIKPTVYLIGKPGVLCYFKEPRIWFRANFEAVTSVLKFINELNSDIAIEPSKRYISLADIVGWFGLIDPPTKLYYYLLERDEKESLISAAFKKVPEYEEQVLVISCRKPFIKKEDIEAS